jgi:hypothetical protein
MYPPSFETPHVRLAPNFWKMTPEHSLSTLPSPFPVYQQLWPYSDEYRHLGLYHLSVDAPVSTDCYIENDGARIVLGNDAWAILVRVDPTTTTTPENRLPSPSPEKEEQQQQKEFLLPPVHSSVNLPPTPPAVEDDDVVVPEEYMRQDDDRDDEYHTKTPTAESYADLGSASSMSESTYSNIDGVDDDDSDRWSVLSTGPVDRQWTVVFSEKEETV